MTKTEVIGALNEIVQCGCGDERPLFEFCHVCGECLTGCCSCDCGMEDPPL